MRQLEPWKLVYTEWDPDEQPLREALCALGNGVFVTRGAFEEAAARSPHYPGTYLAGGYDRACSEVAGHVVENEDLVNWPNWLSLSFRPEGGAWLDVQEVELLELRVELDLRGGTLTRRLVVRDERGRETELEACRLVHMGEPDVAALRWRLRPRNWSGRLEVRSGIDGEVANRGVARYRDLEGRHLDVLRAEGVGEDGIVCVARARQSRLTVAVAARTRLVFDREAPGPVDRVTSRAGGRIEHLLVFPCAKQETVTLEKVVSLHTSRDPAISEPCLQACKRLQRLPGFEALERTHRQAWERLWRRADIRLTGADEAQAVLRLHVFHLLQTASAHSADRDVGVPARGWHGEAYRGHVFWDELYIFPFLDLRIPELTRSLLMYRYRRLPEARHAAAAAGFAGAMFPWQSGSDGRDESQVLHLNPRSGRWIPDTTYKQRHVGAAVAFNVWQYYQATEDAEFLSFYGAELLLEVARFWASVARRDRALGRYRIRDVVGPDEFHTHYAGGEPGRGLDDNAYTNVMAAWCLWTAQRALDLLDEDRRAELCERLDLCEAELRRWDEVGRRLYVPFHGEGIISQFEGYEALEELDWEGYRARYGDIQRLDRILEAEGDTPARYKVSKQADVLMLFYLFDEEELRELFARLGYPFDDGLITRNIDYYLARTSHGSTLSRIVHTWVLTRAARQGSWSLFEQALASDIDDVQGGTTHEGIHLGALAGTVDLVQRCYTGIAVRGGTLAFDPLLPDELSEVRLRVRYRGHSICVTVTHERLHVLIERGTSAPARIGFGGQVFELRAGDERTFRLERHPTHAEARPSVEPPAAPPRRRSSRRFAAGARETRAPARRPAGGARGREAS